MGHGHRDAQRFGDRHLHGFGPEGDGWVQRPDVGLARGDLLGLLGVADDFARAQIAHLVVFGQVEVGATPAEQPVELLATDQDVVAVRALQGVAVGLRMGPAGLGRGELGAEGQRPGLVGRERVVDPQIVGAGLVAAQVEDGLARSQQAAVGVEQVAEHAVLAGHGDAQAGVFGGHAAGVDAQRVGRQRAVEPEAQGHACLAGRQVFTHCGRDVHRDGLRALHGHQVQRGNGGGRRGDITDGDAAVRLGVDQGDVQVPVQQPRVGNAQRAGRGAVAAPQLGGLALRATGEPELAIEFGQAAGRLTQIGDRPGALRRAVAAPQLDRTGSRGSGGEIEDAGHLGEIRRVGPDEAGGVDVHDEGGRQARLGDVHLPQLTATQARVGAEEQQVADLGEIARHRAAGAQIDVGLDGAGDGAVGPPELEADVAVRQQLGARGEVHLATCFMEVGGAGRLRALEDFRQVQRAGLRPVADPQLCVAGAGAGLGAEDEPGRDRGQVGGVAHEHARRVLDLDGVDRQAVGLPEHRARTVVGAEVQQVAHRGEFGRVGSQAGAGADVPDQHRPRRGVRQVDAVQLAPAHAGVGGEEQRGAHHGQVLHLSAGAEVGQLGRPGGRAVGAPEFAALDRFPGDEREVEVVGREIERRADGRQLFRAGVAEDRAAVQVAKVGRDVADQCGAKHRAIGLPELHTGAAGARGEVQRAAGRGEVGRRRERALRKRVDVIQDQLDALQRVQVMHVRQVGREVDVEQPDGIHLGPQHQRVGRVARLHCVAPHPVERGHGVRAAHGVGLRRDGGCQQPDLVAACAVAQGRELEPLLRLAWLQREVVDAITVGVEQVEGLRLPGADIHQVVTAAGEAAVGERNHARGRRQAHQAGRAIDGVHLAGIGRKAFTEHVLEPGAD